MVVRQIWYQSRSQLWNLVATFTWFNELVTEFIGDTNTLTEERTDLRTDSGDHERFAHYVRKEKIVESAVTGNPVVALCGKVWTPTRDPKKFPVCPECSTQDGGRGHGAGPGLHASRHGV